MYSFSDYVLKEIKTLRARGLTVAQVAREMSMSKEAVEAALQTSAAREEPTEKERRPVVQESVPADLRKSLEFLAAHDPKA